MALWLVRGGRNGEFEERFLSDGKVCLTKSGPLTDYDLSACADRGAILDFLRNSYPEDKDKMRITWSSQLNSFALRMQEGDWIAMPRKRKPIIAFGELTSEYRFDTTAEPFFRHYRTVNWLKTDVPRAMLGQDLLYSLGASTTIAKIDRNNAEERIRNLAQRGWIEDRIVQPRTFSGTEENGDESGSIDLETLIHDQVASLIIGRFKGHDMERLVEGILQAQGFSTYHSPEGPDKGVDLLAAPGVLGFGEPRICVQVKTQDTPIDRPTLDQLMGTMRQVGASHGLLVSWSGFKSSVEKEHPRSFFNIRLWNQNDLVEQLLAVYDKLSEELRAELPLKRVWMVAQQSDE